MNIFVYKGWKWWVFETRFMSWDGVNLRKHCDKDFHTVVENLPYIDVRILVWRDKSYEIVGLFKYSDEHCNYLVVKA